LLSLQSNLAGDFQRGTKSDNFAAVLRIEFGKAQVDSAEIPINGENQDLASKDTIAAAATFDITPFTTEGIEHVANNPVIVRVFEAGKADKKKKETILTELAHGRIDLLALVLGETEINRSVRLVPSTTLVDVASGSAGMSCHATVRTNKDILSQQQKRECSIMSVQVDGVFSVPDSWPVCPPTQQPTQAFTFSMSVNDGSPSHRSLILSDGVLTMPSHFHPGHPPSNLEVSVSSV
jgi:hypothetical protein